MTAIERLLLRAHLFDDPSAYEAGVRDAVEVLEASDGADAHTGEPSRLVARSA